MSRTGKTVQLLRLAGTGFLLQLVVLFLPVVSHADGISGFMEYNFSKSDSKSRDVNGSTAKTTGNSLIQRYNLALDRTLYPNLHFAAGGNVELSRSEFESETVNQTSSLTSKQSRFSPFANLRLNTGITSAGLGYSRREESTSTSGAPSFTSITDNYNAQFGFRPQGLPSVDMFYMHLDSYDEERTLQDTSNDSVSFNSKYTQIKNLDLSYQVLFNTMTDRLRSQENRSLSQNARVAYNDTFLNDRVTLYSTYSLASQQTTANGLGEIERITFGTQTFYKDSAKSSDEHLDPAPELQDPYSANTVVTLLDEPENPIGTFVPGRNPQDTKPKSFGVKAQVGSSINAINLITDSELGSAPLQFLLRRYKWKLYQSADATGEIWTLIDDAPSVFVTRDNILSTIEKTVYKISFRFPAITTTVAGSHLKLVATPQDVEILRSEPRSFTVAGLQAAMITSASDERTTTESISGHYELNGRVRILDSPSLFYDMNFSMDHFNADNGASQRYFVTNSLSLAHQFNNTFSASARVTREDSFDPDSTRSAFLYSASLTATPIPALTSSLLFSGRNEEFEGERASSYSLFLNNSAELYKGLNVLLNGGATTSTSATGRRASNALFLFGASLLPHPAATINMSISGRQEWGTGGGLSDSESYKQDNEISLALNPVKSVYLFGSLSLTTETGKKALFNRTMGGSWAPFRDGNLLYNISYNESAASEGSQETRSLAQSLRWYFRSSSYFDVSYLISRNSSLTQNIDSYSLNAAARFTF